MLHPHASVIRSRCSSSPAARSPSHRSHVVEPVTSCDAVLSTAHDDGSLQHLSRNRYGHGAVPPARITADQPVIAVALSEDSQQHWRLWHHSHTDCLRDGRIGYWYTNSRFARGAIVASASRRRRHRPFPRQSRDETAQVTAWVIDRRMPIGNNRFSTNR
jgi:hypothetical protein